VAFCAPLHVLAEIELVRLAGQAAVPGQEPDERDLLLAREELLSNGQSRCRRNHLHVDHLHIRRRVYPHRLGVDEATTIPGGAQRCDGALALTRLDRYP
jgi:hypothetical protein